jgi:hypothetical protein
MGSTVRSLTQPLEAEASPSATIRWNNWPLADCWRWSWLLPVGVLCVGALVALVGDSWLIGLVAVSTLALALWQFFVPVEYEICSLGIRRQAFGRSRLVPWRAIGAYQIRTTGLVLFQRPAPTAIDALGSFFVPNPPDKHELLVAARLYLTHATELPR